MTTCRGTEQTEDFAARLARHLSTQIDPDEAVLIGLIGPLGAGKTAFARGFVRGVDPDEAREVASPTYALVVEHQTTPRVTHADLYRLESVGDLEGIGYREVLFGAGFTLVEWIDRFAGAMGDEWIEIRLAVSGEDVREIQVRGHGERAQALLERFDEATQ